MFAGKPQLIGLSIRLKIGQFGYQFQESINIRLLIVDQLLLKVQVLQLRFDHFVVGGGRALVGQEFLKIGI